MYFIYMQILAKGIKTNYIILHLAGNELCGQRNQTNQLTCHNIKPLTGEVKNTDYLHSVALAIR